MRNFLTSLLGTLAGLVLFFGAAGLCLVVFLAALAATKQTQAGGPVEEGAYLVFNLDVNLSDAPAPFGGAEVLEALRSGQSSPATLQTRDVVRALDAASKDASIAGLFLEGSLQPGRMGGIATLREVRQAVERFKESGKPVVGYVESMDFRDYYLCSAASEVWLDPYTEVTLTGLASMPLFYSGALEKLGVGVQVTRVGKFKSAIEPFTRPNMSPEAREQLQAVVDDLWSDLKSDIATSRKLDPSVIQFLADNEGLLGADLAIQRSLADRKLYRDEVLEELKARTGRMGSKELYKSADLAAYIDRLPPEAPPATPGPRTDRTDSRIAVVYAEGTIVDGAGNPDEVGGDRYADELRRLRDDVNVKAVVLRVNSPGGSAIASEHILRELQLTKKAKPVVVSMGSYAASGGYWISAYGDRIFAESTTITGSIGVFGMFFNFEKLGDTLGLSVDGVKTARRADMLTASRPKTEEELAVLQRAADFIYEEFVSKVAEGRGLDKAKVRQIGEGRVWTGAAAKRLGLVDDIGGLPEAIAWAAQKAGVQGAPRIEEFPRKRGLEEFLAEAIAGMGQADARRASVFEKWLQTMRHELRSLSAYNDPRGLYALMPVQIGLQ